MSTRHNLHWKIGICTLLTLASIAFGSGHASTTEHDPEEGKATKAAKPYPFLEEVIVVYKTHFDIGYSALARDVIHKYRTEMVDRVLDAIEQNKHQAKEQQFVWTVSGWPMQQILWKGQAPDRRRKIENAIRDGNLVVHAYPFTTHTETAEMEDLVRGLGHASSIARTYGLPLPRDAKTSDVPGQSWILPTLLKHAGVNFFHLGGPLVNKSLGLPPMFWWEGPDGSRLLTLYNNGYGTSPLPPKGWPYKTWIYISMTGDNVGPPNPDTVKNDIEFYHKNAPDLKVTMGKLDDFGERILKEDLSKLPIVRSDLPDPWVHGNMAMPDGWKLANAVRPSIPAAEALMTLEKCWGLYRPSIKDTIAKAYEQSLLFSEHTWGLATQHYISQPYGKAWEVTLAQGLPTNAKVLEESWQEHFDYIDNVRKLIVGTYAEAVATLADSVNISGKRVVVYNPLPWKRDGLVEFNACYWPGFSALEAVDNGQHFILDRVGSGPTSPESKIVRFIAKDIPPMGYRTFIPAEIRPVNNGLVADEAAATIESPYFKVKFDPAKGHITSLFDKQTNRELVDSTARRGFGQYFYERFGRKEIENYLDAALYPQFKAHRYSLAKYDVPANSVYASALSENMELYMQKSNIDVSAVMTGKIPGPGMPQNVSIRLTLYADMPVADLEVGYQKQPDGWPEAGWICLPFQFEKPRFRLGRLGADLDPVTDITVENVNYHQIWINTGIAIYDDKGYGVGICPMDTPLVSLGQPGSHKFSRRYEPTKATVYLNLYNNHWQTNFPNWVGGRRSSRVRLWTFEKFQSEPALYSPSMETRVPLRVARSTCKPGVLPATQAGIILSRKGVAVTAFGENPDGDGLIFRLWEQGGISGKLTVNLPKGMKVIKATPVNLRGEKTGKTVTIRNGRLEMHIGAYAPASFVLEDVR